MSYLKEKLRALQLAPLVEEPVVENVQDISIGSETPTPRLGQTLEEKFSVLKPDLTTSTPMEAQAPASQGIMSRMQDIQGKDYSKAKYDESGNILKPAGADRDKKWSLGEKFAGIASGILQGLGNGEGLLGAGIRAAQNGSNRNFLEQRADADQLRKLGGQYQQAAANEEFQNTQGLKQAQTADVIRRPAKERQAFEQKMVLQMQNQAARLNAQAEKFKAENASFDKMITKNGQFYAQYKDGKQVPLTGPDGQPEKDLLNTPVEYTTESGAKVFMKGSQLGNVEATKAYRDATLALGKDRLAETQRSNRVREGLAQKQFDETKAWRQQQLTMRQQIEDRLVQAQQNGDTVTAERLANEKAKLDTYLQEREAFWKTNIGKGGFTKEDYDELVGQ